MKSTFKVQITKTDEASASETIVFTQHVEDLDVQKFIRDLNVTPRRRKTKAGTRSPSELDSRGAE